MKRFIIACFCLGLFAAGTLLVANYIRNRIEPIRFGEEVFEAIRISDSHFSAAHTVIIGDSVANQLFNPAKYQGERPEIAYLTSNQAVTPIGNLLLLKRYLAANPQTQEVFYMLRPSSILNCGDISYTFHYFIYPFVESGIWDQIDAEGGIWLERRFGKYVFSSKIFRRIVYSDDYLYLAYESWLKRNHKRIGLAQTSGIPDVCLMCIREMDRICREKDIGFRVLSSPLNLENAKRYESLTQAITAHLSGAGAESYKRLQIVLPDDWFVDGIHFKDDSRREQVVKMIFAQIGVETR